MDEAVLHAGELIDIVNNRTSAWGHALVLHKSLNKRISAEGNTKPLVARCHESLDLSDDALQAATAIVQADPSLSHMSALRDSTGALHRTRSI